MERDGQWSEASPLPGFSGETIDDVIDALREDKRDLASLQFALTALDNPIQVPTTVPFNQLLVGDRKQVLENVKQCVDAGCKAAKLKVGRKDICQEIELIKEVRDALPETVQLRLDANQAWDFEDAIKFVSDTKNIDIEFIEEPLRESGRLEELYLKTGVKYALDESLLQETSIDKWPNAAALICKPTILGGRPAVENLVNSGKPIVFSSAFESGIGVARIAQLVAEYSPDVAAGLDTLGWFGKDLLLESPQKHDGWLTISSEPRVVTDHLERIDL